MSKRILPAEDLVVDLDKGLSVDGATEGQGDHLGNVVNLMVS